MTVMMSNACMHVFFFTDRSKAVHLFVIYVSHVSLLYTHIPDGKREVCAVKWDAGSYIRNLISFCQFPQ